MTTELATTNVQGYRPILDERYEVPGMRKPEDNNLQALAKSQDPVNAARHKNKVGGNQ
jgi:hypothetical protein